ncbi:MAG: SCO family protein [Candidatus Marinimicrobia bacterium]|nr:SCO family protein [Candidatus Neomarinimicrobiota bacterium]MCH7763112.1 SCO family protein [Candidatus Neomarinimicrobiota bacterium]
MISRNRFIIYILIGTVIAALWWTTKPILKPLPTLGGIPFFEMIDTNGSSFGSENLRGKIWVADFIFTTCAGPCPIMSTEMSGIHKAFIDDKNIQTVTYTVNPDYDTPEVLAQYAKRYNADTEQWHFLNAPYEDIQSIITNGFKMGDMEEIVFHSTRFALVDRNMNIRGYYTGTDSVDVEKLKRDIVQLSKL